MACVEQSKFVKCSTPGGLLKEMSAILRNELKKKIFKPNGDRLFAVLPLAINVMKLSASNKNIRSRTLGNLIVFQSSLEKMLVTESTILIHPKVYSVIYSSGLWALQTTSKLTNCQDVQITFVKIMTSNQNEQYEKVNTWHLKDLKLLDGKEADEDNPHFEMHFDKIYNWEASSTASKYAFLRCLLELNNIYLGEEIVFVNFDTNYLYENSATINKGDCLLVMNLCVLYFCNCVCLSLTSVDTNLCLDSVLEDQAEKERRAFPSLLKDSKDPMQVKLVACAISRPGHRALRLVEPQPGTDVPGSMMAALQLSQREPDVDVASRRRRKRK
eukprot:gi/632950991/ref/XP_007891040.1/ PREDICTED: uncharacterized protein LOC103178224 [Callorhinchus milii]